jgi:hypothetical protein
MTHEQLMEYHKIVSDVEDLNSAEREVYDAFLELAETDRDVEILSRAWLKQHRRKVLYG